jgi:hypothetical protein
VTVFVVDLFKIIKIENTKGEYALSAIGESHFPLEDMEKIPPVVCTSQIIMNSLLSDEFVRLVQLAVCVVEFFVGNAKLQSQFIDITTDEREPYENGKERNKVEDLQLEVNAFR